MFDHVEVEGTSVGRQRQCKLALSLSVFFVFCLSGCVHTLSQVRGTCVCWVQDGPFQMPYAPLGVGVGSAAT